MTLIMAPEIKKHPSIPRAFQCRCGRPVFFRNSLCLACRSPLGYEPHSGRLEALIPGFGDGTWHIESDIHPYSRQDAQSLHPELMGKIYLRCSNLESPAACNWLVPVSDFGYLQPSLCISCRLNRTIPDLSSSENAKRWELIEQAKRRLVSSLIALGLPTASRVEEDTVRGLAFDFLESTPECPRILTGHEDGIVTINIEEAHHATRERIREQMHEPYRTLLGHLRHEVGHYYWDRLVSGTPYIDNFRILFGDERQDYTEALIRHYEHGAAADWQRNHVSAYASTHPWEDWAETWAHYLHMIDTLDTAFSFALDIDKLKMPFECFDASALSTARDYDGGYFLSLVNSWSRLSAVLNELSRSMGEHDFYPFVLSTNSVRKFHFVHMVVQGIQFSR